MAARQSAAVDLALKLIGRPKPGGGVFTPYAAAKEAGISLSSVYRGMERHGLKPASNRASREAELLAALSGLLPIFIEAQDRLSACGLSEFVVKQMQPALATAQKVIAKSVPGVSQQG